MITKEQAIILLLFAFRPEHISMWLSTYPSNHTFSTEEEVFQKFIEYINKL